ncbi:MAG: phosphomethylpyrimidine synthase ThiC [Candidatus Lokiarchaeota archaeon]|nr:phosphomethylpyrimidine synthase ThiC [Candidatus Lokiarchaeota archaeon]
MNIPNEKLGKSLADEIKLVAKEERIDPNTLKKRICNGKVVILKLKDFAPVGIGEGLRTKINVNLGTSSSEYDRDQEIQKVLVAQKHGADTISDLSMGGNIDQIRNELMEKCTVPITTVPIYQAVVQEGSMLNISNEAILKVIERQIKDGVSSIVIHAGFSLDDLNKIKGRRIMGMVSKGGSFTASIMSQNNTKNPFLDIFDYILEMMLASNTVLNLGNAMRSGCVHDLIDEPQFAEMLNNSRLATLANKKGVQVILESLGGHVNARDLIQWIKIHKQVTNSRPLFVSGPLPTEIGLGYDHISASIGATLASGYGADYICAITPAEHLGLPSVDDIKNGLIACKLAAHVGDSMKYGLNHLFDPDLQLSKHRFLREWEQQFQISLNTEYLKEKFPKRKKDCSMCGKYCALLTSKRIFDNFN